MKSAFVLLFVTVLVICVSASTTSAQTETDPALVVQDLKLQLIDINAKEEIAKLQAQQLDEALKPENIESSLAGVGSTRPEDLREERRRQLTIEKKTVDAQLEQLAIQRSRLEADIATAETQAYQQSAKGTQLPSGDQLGFLTLTPARLLVMGLVAVFALGFAVVVFVVLRSRLGAAAQR